MPKVKVTGIKASFPVSQGIVNAMMKPELGGNSVSDLNSKLEGKKNCEIGAVFRSISSDTSYDAPCNLKNFTGSILISEDLDLTIEGDGEFNASAYAQGLIEDEGSAEVWFCDLNIDGIELGLETDSEETWVKLATVSG